MKLISTILPEHKDLKEYELEKLCADKNLNPMFFRCIKKFLEGKQPILFMLAGNDPGTEIFENYFQGYFLKQHFFDRCFRNNYQIIKIVNANHVYSLIEWQNELIDSILRWLNEKF
jgi:hypothetical protein